MKGTHKRDAGKWHSERNITKGIGIRYFLVIGYCVVAAYVGIHYQIDLVYNNDSGLKEFPYDSVSSNKGPMRSLRYSDHKYKFEKTRKRIISNRSKRKPKIPVKVLHKAPSELRLPKPIVNVGFPKAGTSTLFSYFHCNGLKSQHWLCCDPQDHPGRTKNNKLMSRCVLENMILGKPLFEKCGDYDVYSEFNGPRNFADLHYRTLLDDGQLLTHEAWPSSTSRIFFPQHHQLDELHKYYPNATLVLNQRPIFSWIESVVAWEEFLPYYILNEFYEQNSTRFLFENTVEPNNRSYIGNDTTKRESHQRETDSWHGIGKVPFTSENIRSNLEIVYRYHIDYVRKWAERHPSHTLIEIDITNETAGKTLSDAFGLKEECWGHFNKNDAKKKNSNGRVKKALPLPSSESKAKDVSVKNENSPRKTTVLEHQKQVSQVYKTTPRNTTTAASDNKVMEHETQVLHVDEITPRTNNNNKVMEGVNQAPLVAKTIPNNTTGDNNNNNNNKVLKKQNQVPPVATTIPNNTKTKSRVNNKVSERIRKKLAAIANSKQNQHTNANAIFSKRIKKDQGKLNIRGILREAREANAVIGI